MSQDVRQVLADAASDVEGITCHPYFIQTAKAGDALVRLGRVDYDDFRDGVTRWDVVVMLPQDQTQAEKYIDDHLGPIKDALDAHWQIKSAQPQQLNIPGVGTVLTLVIAGLREQE